MRRVPAAIGKVVEIVPPTPVHCLTPSTQINMFVTVLVESVVPAIIPTGEGTVLFGAGAQMVTEGSAVFRLQGGDTAATLKLTDCLARVLLKAFTVTRCGPGVMFIEVLSFG